MSLPFSLQPLHTPILQRKRATDALPVAVLYDNFNSGANDATLAGRAPLVRPNANTWAVTNSFVTSNGKAEARFPSAGNAILRFDTGRTDIDLSVDFTLPTTGNNRGGGVLFHYVSSNTYLYTLANLDNGVFRVNMLNGGATTVLDEIAFTFSAGVQYHMRLVYVADRIFSTIDGIGTIAIDLAAYDLANATTIVATYGASTVHGLRGSNQAGQGAVVFDNVHFVDPPPAADVFVTIGAQIMTSQMDTAVSHVDNDDLRLANTTARTRAIATLTDAFVVHNQPFASFGSSDPWPWDGTGTRPAEPTNWNSLKAMVNYIRDMNGEPCITTDFIPWHLKGRLFGDGHTEPCVPGETFDKDGRVMTNKQADWLLLIQRCAETFLAAPYNVRIWQTGIEYHGDLRGIELDFNPIAWHAYPGTPGANADVGASYMHNITVQRIIDVATNLGIAREDLTFIPNYPRLRAKGVASGADSVDVGHPLRDKPWGTAEEPGFEAVVEMAKLIDDYSDCWAVDFSMSNIDGILPNHDDPFAVLEKITDYLEFVKAEMVTAGIVGKRIVVSEIYLSVFELDANDNQINQPPDAGNAQYRAAMQAEGLRRMLLAGVWLPMHWSTQGRDMDSGYELLGALVSDMSLSSGGVEQPVLTVEKLFHEHFPAGTAIHDVTITGDGVSALASASKILLINQTNADKTVNVDNATYTVGAYGRLVVDY